jgi:hypothetical protein
MAWRRTSSDRPVSYPWFLRTKLRFRGLAANAAAGLSSWLAIEFRADLAQQRARVEQASRLVSTRCGQVEMAEAGQGPALLVVHGSGGGFDQGLALGADYAARGCAIEEPALIERILTHLGLSAQPPPCRGDPKFPHLRELKIPHPVHDSVSSVRTSPAFNFSFRRYELPRMLTVTA